MFMLYCCLGTKLNKRKYQKTGRIVVINSDVLGLISKDDRFTREYYHPTVPL